MRSPTAEPSASCTRAPRRRLQALVAGTCLCLLGAVAYFIIYPFVLGSYVWRQAEQALARRDFAQARAQLRRYLDLWPQSGEAHFVLARTARRAGDGALARAELERAEGLRWHAELIELERLLGRGREVGGRTPHPALRGVVDNHHPEEKYVLEALIVSCLANQLPAEADGWARLWQERYPEDWQAHYWRGVALESGAHMAQAAEHYEAALRQQPDYPEGHLRLAGVLLRQGLYRGAVPHFEQYLRTDPQHQRVRLDLAGCQRGCGDASAARATLAGLPTDDPRAALLRGQLDLDEGQPDRALAWLRQAQAAAPYEAETNAALAAALRALHRDQEAEQYTRAAQQIRADVVRVMEIARAMLSGQNAAALRFEAGTITRRLGREEAAAHWFASACILDRNDPAARRALAEALHKSDELTAEDWLTAFTDWGARGYFDLDREADFSTALALYRRALQEAAADPAFEPPAGFLPELPPGQRRNRWRRTRSFPQVEAAWEWLAEMHCRKTDNLPPLTEAEFASLARWFQENDSRLAQSEPAATLADLRAGLARGPRALGSGKWAEYVRRLLAQHP